MMSSIVPLGWFVHIFLCFYVIRFIRTFWYRTLLALIPCLIFLWIGCQDLPYLHMSSIMIVSLYWMITIRLFQSIILSPSETQSTYDYISKFLWLLVPIVPCESKDSIQFYLFSACIKILFNHWIFKWLSVCEPNSSYGRTAMFYIMICTGTFINDLQVIIIRTITMNKYSLLDFNDHPYLSKSIREFWGRRYNRLVSTLLREAIFEPVRRLPLSSTMTAALASFIVSGLLHAHVAVAAFGAPSPLPSFFFFFIHGIICCLETLFPIHLPTFLRILLTQGLLLLTSPLYVGLFTNAGSQYYEVNKPLLFDAEWIPKIPLPNFCPK